MPDQTSDLSRLVAATVNRLRLIQVDFADQPAEVRENYLSDEVEHALAKLLPDQRAPFVKELKERFPTWEGNVDVTAPSQDSSNVQSASDAKDLQDYTFLIARLVKLAPTLTEEQRKTAIARLRDAGFVEQGTGPEWPPQPLKVLKTKLQLTDRDKIDAGKLLELTSEIISFATSLDQLVWATWKQVAPKSDMKRPTPVQRTCDRFVAGDAEFSRTQITADVDKLRQLTAGLISAIAQAGNLFAQKHVGKFSVANIEAYADKMPGMLVGKEVKCWRQYKELSSAMDVQAIEIEIQNAIAEYTETLIKGRRPHLIHESRTTSKGSPMSGPVHWHEGLFLQPQHLQTMQHYLLERIGSERRLGYTFPHGIIDMKLSADALENMLIRFDRLRVVMPSGLEVYFPESADLPSLDIKQAFEANSNPFTVSLAVPLWYSTRANTVDAAAGNTGNTAGGGGDWRVKRVYKVSEIQRTDENTGENSQPMMIRKINARLILDEDDHTDLETVPLLKIAHATGQDVGTARQEPTYIPPCLVINGSSTLREKLRDLANQVQASRSTLVQQITAGGFSIDAMRGVQFEQAMRLRTLNRYAASLGSLITVLPQIRPYDFYLVLRELLGELSASHPDRDKEFIVPEYEHENLAGSFDDLINKIRSLLGGTVQERYLKIDFIQEGAVLVLKDPLSPEHFEKPTDYFLGIKTHEDHGALAKLVEDGDKFKLMAKSMIQQRIWGIKLQEERHPPLTLPAKGDLFYYRLMRGESQRMWDRIKDEKTMAVRWPDMQTADYQMALYMPIP